MTLLDNDKVAMKLDMVATSKDMMESDIVQKKAASMDNNVGQVYGMAWEAFGLVEAASEMAWEPFGMVEVAFEMT